MEINDDLINNLAKSILKLAKSKELREKMGKNSKNAEIEFSPERYYNDYMNIVVQ